MPPPIHVLHVVGAPSLHAFGGTPIKLLYQIRHSPADVRFTVCCLAEEGALASEFRRSGVEVIALRQNRSYNVAVIPQLTRIIRKLGVDVVHTHFARAGVYGRLAAILTGTPAVVSDHGIIGNRSGIVWILDNLLNLGTHTRVANSHATADANRRRSVLSAKKSRVIHNGVPDIATNPRTGIETRLRWGVEPDAFLVVNVGSHIAMRDQACLIRAVHRVRAVIPHLRLLLAGAGETHRLLHDLVGSLDLIDVVSLPGNVAREQVHQLLVAADVFVNAAHLEAFGMATVEAMLAHVPVLCARGGSLPELLPAEYHELLLFEPGDDAGLAQRIQRLAAEPDLRRKLATAGRAFAAERFSVTRFVDEFLQVYHDCVALTTGPTASQ